MNAREPPPTDHPATAPGLVIAGYRAPRPAYRARRSGGTADWVIFYTLAGEGTFRVGQAIATAQPGDVTLIPPGVPHDYASWSGDWVFHWAHFPARPEWVRWLQLPANLAGLPQLAVSSHANQERLRAAFERLIPEAGEAVRPSQISQELALNAIEEILLICAREARINLPGLLDSRVEAVIELITSDLAARHRLSDLAVHVALSPSRLAHLFKAQTGASIFELLLQMRLERATRLLAHTMRAIGDVSDSLGFGSPFYFSRQFRHRYGVSPTAYRARATRSAALPR